MLLAALAVSAFATDSRKVPANVAKAAKAAKAAATGKKPQQPVPQPEPTPAQPVVPLRPSQLPSVPPRVSFQNGLLTVVAENSTVADILGAIKGATGIRIESTGGPSGDRVAAKIGPAPPRQVLLSLFQGSHYDYVMLGSAADPERIERVILTPRSGNAAVASAPQAPLRAPQAEQEDPDIVQDEGDPNQPDYEPAGQPMTRGDEAPPTQEQPQPQGQQPQNSTNPNPPLDQSQPQGQQPQNEVRSPEQMLQDLRMQQQRAREQQNSTEPK
jgi:hypothetical protein